MAFSWLCFGGSTSAPLCCARRPCNDVFAAAGEFIIVPRLVEHCPSVPTGEVECMLFEPATTLNTGNVVSDKTVTELDEMTDGDLKRGSGNEYNRSKG